MEMIPAKTIIGRVPKPSAWFGAEYNMNIYRGCTHGCIYCDSRSDCYGDKSFDLIKVKEGALEKIRDELRRKVKSGVIATGAMSDPYNHLEYPLKLTRNALELISAYEFGVAIATKSSMVARDADVLEEIASHSPVIVKLTITTADSDLCKKLEPWVSNTDERFEAIRALSERGIYCGVLMMPILPFINDTEENITELLERAKEAGARFCYPAFGMTLRSGNREYFYEKLDERFPGMKEKYIARYGESYGCPSPRARQLWGAFKERCDELGLLYNMRDIVSQYKAGYEREQLRLF